VGDPGDGTTTPDGSDPTDPTTTDPTVGDPTDPNSDPTGSGDPTVVGSDPDSTPADPDATGTTNPDAPAPVDTTSDQQTLEQTEQQESQAAQSGDYSTASNDAQLAYQESQTIANEGGPDNTDQTWTAEQNESQANWDQQTAEQDQTTADSYANDPNALPSDAADAQLYGDAAQNEEGTADNYGEAGAYGDPVGEPVDTPTDTTEDAPVEDAPVDEAPVDDTPVDDSPPADDTAVDDDSSAS
jgi:hypothetical protein